MRARAFFYVCAGILLLALAYHLGARSATAQSGDRTVVALALGFDYLGNATSMALTAGGDVYVGDRGGGSWRFGGDIFTGATGTPTESWGSVKARYLK